MSTYDYDSDAPQPDLGEVQQAPEKLPPLCVTVEGPVRSHVLPSRAGASRTYLSDAAADPMILLGQDLRRRRAIIIAADSPIYVGARDDVAAGEAAIWPAAVPLELQHTEQIYARATTGTAQISVISEYWAD